MLGHAIVVQGLLNVTEDGMHVITNTVDGLKFQ
jgi:hypothetical protein